MPCTPRSNLAPVPELGKAVATACVLMLSWTLPSASAAERTVFCEEFTFRW